MQDAHSSPCAHGHFVAPPSHLPLVRLCPLLQLPGALGPVSFDSIPGGLAAVKAVPIEGWAQIVLAVSALEVRILLVSCQ